ncbi:isoprenoid synthase domain-containing protein [Pelagophyceae sp. CCMP2097]|nr:isoprenoid synthase domain-containing protein [Pelagophyceae sp. CCMP2097]
MRATDFSADAAIDADAIDAALRRDAFEEFPGLTVDPFKSMLNGFRKDLSSDELRFESWDPHLRLYCEQVAGTVGLMLLPLLTDEAPSEDTVRRAVDLGVAIQLTNILRDVGADVDLGRVYLPEEDLEACGITSRAVTDRRLSAGYVDCVKMQVSRARHLYASARVGAAALPPTSRFAVCAVIRLLSAILDELEARNFDNLAAKVRISKTVKLSAVANAAWDALFAKAPKDSPPTRKPLIQI